MLNKWRLLLAHPEPSLPPSLQEQRRYGLCPVSDSPLWKSQWPEILGFIYLPSTPLGQGIEDRVESMGILYKPSFGLNKMLETEELLYSPPLGLRGPTPLPPPSSWP